jgi:hypothetical protein
MTFHVDVNFFIALNTDIFLPSLTSENKQYYAVLARNPPIGFKQTIKKYSGGNFS